MDLWFIYSPLDETWAGVRIAAFSKTINATPVDVVTILGEMPYRIGVRVWQDIEEREKWVKVKRIETPTADEIARAMG